MFLEILQNPEENTYAGIWEISKNNIFPEQLRATASTLNNHEKQYNDKEKQ